MINSHSIDLYSKAQKLIPGGVNSPVRAFKSVGLNPHFIKSAKGSRIIDEDGNEFIDFVCSWGPLILGHCNPEVLEAIEKTMRDGTSFGAPTKREIEMAETICSLVPSVEMVRLVSSGTEATMSAIRLARGFTGRDLIIKFSGCYHGHSDSLLARAGSGAATFSIPDSLGVPSGVVAQTLVATYNDLDETREKFRQFPGKIAAVIVEPVAGNMGVVLPKKGFLEGLRTLCSDNDSVLIFDEVMTGFRVALGGAQELYGVQPDMTCMGKVIGGGLPVAAFGGAKNIMECLAPVGGVYQAGTLSGNPLAVAAGIETLRILKRDNPYQDLENKSKALEMGLKKIFDQKNIDHCINRVGSMMSVFFQSGPVDNYEQALDSDKMKFNNFFEQMLENGIYLAPSAFEAWFISSAHSMDDIDKTLKGAQNAVGALG
ncbi:MAG: glutamate-1-semialdehyde 2,1-aminomutase [Syntrophaceae bacterium]|nr:glutamate-1-semialdehyde 2,1-aminomutase [Syntrophaceae bacterium]